MKKYFLIFVLSFCSVVMLYAQVEEKAAAEQAVSTTVKAATIDENKNWKCTGTVGLNAAQTGLFNWAAGGNSNVTAFLFGNVTLSFKKDKWTWDTNLDTEIGQMYSSDLNPKWRKSNDKINLTTKGGYQMHPQFYLTLLGSFKSQYAPGFTYLNDEFGNKTLISKCLSPSYTDLALGVEYRPNDIFTVGVFPVAGRLTTCLYDSLRPNYGLPQREDGTYSPLSAALGLRINGGINYTLVKNLKIISTITLFTPYTSKQQKFGNFDVDWDVAITYNFLKVFSVSLMTSMKYYDQVKIDGPEWGKYKEGPRARLQFKEVVGLGIGYSF